MGKDWRISIIKHGTSSILNPDLTRLMGWLTHEIQETNYRMADSGLIKLPFDKIMKNDETEEV